MEPGKETYVKVLVDDLQAVGDALELILYYTQSPWAPAGDQLHFEKLVTANPFVRLGVELPFGSLRQRLDVLHMTYATPLWSAAPLVVTVHDICYATNPEWFSPRDVRVLSTFVPRSIRRPPHVITVSESARRRIIATDTVLEAKSPA